MPVPLLRRAQESPRPPLGRAAVAHRLAHPSYGVQKTYVAEVPGPVPARVGRALREGVELEDGPARADAFRVVQQSGTIDVRAFYQQLPPLDWWLPAPLVVLGVAEALGTGALRGRVGGPREPRGPREHRRPRRPRRPRR